MLKPSFLLPSNRPFKPSLAAAPDLDMSLKAEYSLSVISLAAAAYFPSALTASPTPPTSRPMPGISIPIAMAKLPIVSVTPVMASFMAAAPFLPSYMALVADPTALPRPTKASTPKAVLAPKFAMPVADCMVASFSLCCAAELMPADLAYSLLACAVASASR